MNTTWRYWELGGTATGLLLSALILLSFGGCASMWQPKMDADQLKAIAADKNAGVSCATVTGMYGSVRYATINLDKGVSPNSSITLDGEKCAATITTHKDAPKP